MAKNIKNIAASVHDRLLKLARKTSRPFNELLQLFAIERFTEVLPSLAAEAVIRIEGRCVFLDEEPPTLG